MCRNAKCIPFCNIGLANKYIYICVYTHIHTLIIIIMVIFKCYFYGEHIALSIKIKKQQQWCEHGIRKNQQIKSTVHDAN